MGHSDKHDMQYSDNDTVVTVFGGAVTGRAITHPDRAFALEISTDLIKGAKYFTRKPPMHFHTQEEYIESVQGKMCLEIEGQEIVLTPEDGAYTIKPYANHRSFPMPLEVQDEGLTEVKFLLSGEKTAQEFGLSIVFFENWYKYQNEIVVGGKDISLVQLLSTFDAGGTYLSFPSWVPFGQSISQGLGVTVGRWAGGLLGFQPFYQKWTTDWQTACNKMNTSVCQRRFAKALKSE